MDQYKKEKPASLVEEKMPRLRTCMVLGALLFLGMVPSVGADHSSSCFLGHDGIHAFPLTAGEVVLETEDDPRLGPFADKSVTLNQDGPTMVFTEIDSSDPNRLETEIVQLDLVGSHPDLGVIVVSESATLVSDGEVLAGSPCFPADSSFNVYFETKLNGIPAHNHEPKTMSAILDDIPPTPGNFYEDPEAILLYSGPSHPGPPLTGEFHVATVYSAKHTPTREESVPPVSLTVGGTVRDGSPPAPAVGLGSMALLGAALFLANRRRT